MYPQQPYVVPGQVGTLSFSTPSQQGVIPVMSPEWEDQVKFQKMIMRITTAGDRANDPIAIAVKAWLSSRCGPHIGDVPTREVTPKEIATSIYHKCNDKLSVDEPKNVITTQDSADLIRRLCIGYFVFTVVRPFIPIDMFTELFNPMIKPFNDDLTSVLNKLIELNVIEKSSYYKPELITSILRDVDPFSGVPICEQLFTGVTNVTT